MVSLLLEVLSLKGDTFSLFLGESDLLGGVLSLILEVPRLTGVTLRVVTKDESSLVPISLSGVMDVPALINLGDGGGVSFFGEVPLELYCARIFDDVDVLLLSLKKSAVFLACESLLHLRTIKYTDK